MTTDTTLIEKREELKRRLVAGEYKTLVDIFLEWLDRLIRKIVRRPEPLPIWLVGLVLYVVITLISTGITYISGDWSNFRLVAESYGLGFEIGFLISQLDDILFIVSTLVINQYLKKLMVDKEI
jgi:hypothetical protein